MPGTRTSGRPGGNPDIVNYSFSTEREEPLVCHFQLKISRSVKDRLEALPNKAEFVRLAISAALEELETA